MVSGEGGNSVGICVYMHVNRCDYISGGGVSVRAYIPGVCVCGGVCMCECLCANMNVCIYEFAGGFCVYMRT